MIVDLEECTFLEKGRIDRVPEGLLPRDIDVPQESLIWINTALAQLMNQTMEYLCRVQDYVDGTLFNRKRLPPGSVPSSVRDS